MAVTGLGELRFLYVGTDDTDGAVTRWVEDLGATLRWRFRAFGADVAGLEVGASGPRVLLAAPRPAGAVPPSWSVADPDDAVSAMRARGWTVEGPMGTPEGEAAVLTAPDGSRLALLQVERPGAMDHAFADEGNERRVT